MLPGSAEQALNLACATHDVAVIDMSLSDDSGLNLVKKLRVKFSECPILLLASHDEPEAVERALQAGAQGYMLKQDETQLLALAVRQVLQGQLYISGSMRSRMLQSMMYGRTEKSPVSGLTNSEFNLLYLIGTGLRANQIAEKLTRSIKTINTHRASIKEKLALDNNAALTIFAARWVNENRESSYAR